MVKNLLVLVMAIMLLPAGLFAEVTKFSIDNIETGVEYNWNEFDLTDIKLLQVSGGSIDGKIDIYGNNFDTKQQLLTLGYQLNESLTPYLILGQTTIKANVRVIGTFVIGGYVTSGDLLEIDYNGSPELTWGGGIKGNLIELPAEIKLGYDIRLTSNDGVEDTETPTILSLASKARSEIEYSQWDASLIAKKEIKLAEDRKIIKAITPSIGFKFTDTTTSTKLYTSLYGLDVSMEQNYKSALYSAIAGVNVKITDKIDLNVVGSYGGVKGVNAGVTVKF